MWRAHERGCSIDPNMMVTFDRRPTEWAARWASNHSSVLTLSGHSTAANLVVEDLGRGAREGLEAGVAQLGEVLGERHPGAAGPFGDLERGEGVDVDALGAGPHRLQHVEVVVAVEVGVDAALEAHLGRAKRLGLGDPSAHLVQVEQVRGAAQIERQRALRERAELAPERADVGVVDVAVDHEGDVVARRSVVAAGRPARPPSRTSEPRAENKVTISSSPTSWPPGHPGQDLADRAPGAGGGRPVDRVEEGRRVGLPARAPRRLPRQALGVGGVEDEEAHRVVEPALGVEGDTRGRW